MVTDKIGTGGMGSGLGSCACGPGLAHEGFGWGTGLSFPFHCFFSFHFSNSICWYVSSVVPAGRSWLGSHNNVEMASRSGTEALWAEQDIEESPNEDSDDNVSETEDLAEGISDEDDDDAVLGAMTFDNNFKMIPCPDQVLHYTARDNTVWTNNIPTTGRRSVVNIWKGRQKEPGPRMQIQEVKDAASKLDIYKLMITEEMVDSVVAHTNERARSVIYSADQPIASTSAAASEDILPDNFMEVQAEIEIPVATDPLVDTFPTEDEMPSNVAPHLFATIRCIWEKKAKNPKEIKESEF
ncbi:unnamed protein product [Allacma fusca]|uniref:Uncharacterized protein n=1 Tax=Allacma fusca TaxID=39272 RepID=A0A8J2KZC4_9HEXA|nr:unnamed protein product [Allacma fusca]